HDCLPTIVLPPSSTIFPYTTLFRSPPIQNLAFLQHYNWDGHKRTLESQALVPIITREEMDSSILEVMEKLQKDSTYKNLFLKARSEEHTSELQSRFDLVCRLLLEKK